MSKEFNEESKVNAEESGEDSEYVYKKVIKNKEQRRTWSVASLVLAVLSVLLFYFSWVSLILGLASIGAAIVSRKNLGYFDKISVAALIVAIFGAVFAVTGIAFGSIFETLFG